MTDELVYERLAISIAQTHSILPRLHGEVVRSLAQLYPMLISPWFSHGYVPENLKNAHAFDAWLMSSACIPAFLLARRVTGRRWAAYMLAVLTACTPWIVYSTVLLTEVAAYPAFMWAMLGMHKALTSPSARNDVLAFFGLALAFFARTQLVGLIAVLPAAMLVYALTRRRRRSRRAQEHAPRPLRSHACTRRSQRLRSASPQRAKPLQLERLRQREHQPLPGGLGRLGHRASRRPRLRTRDPAARGRKRLAARERDPAACGARSPCVRLRRGRHDRGDRARDLVMGPRHRHLRDRSLPLLPRADPPARLRLRAA